MLSQALNGELGWFGLIWEASLSALIAKAEEDAMGEWPLGTQEGSVNQFPSVGVWEGAQKMAGEMAGNDCLGVWAWEVE